MDPLAAAHAQVVDDAEIPIDDDGSSEDQAVTGDEVVDDLTFAAQFAVGIGADNVDTISATTSAAVAVKSPTVLVPRLIESRSVNSDSSSDDSDSELDREQFLKNVATCLAAEAADSDDDGESNGYVLKTAHEMEVCLDCLRRFHSALTGGRPVRALFAVAALPAASPSCHGNRTARASNAVIGQGAACQGGHDYHRVRTGEVWSGYWPGFGQDLL
jgi:hypothetical protein